MKNTKYLQLLAIILVMIFTTLNLVNAQTFDGMKDPDFVNGGGFTSYALYAETNDGIVLDDGSFITVGEHSISSNNKPLLMMKYKADGVVDSSFGTDGVVSFKPFNADRTPAHKIIAHEDGKLTVIASPQIHLLRFNADGSLDESYGDGGLASPDYGFSYQFHPYDAVELPDGKFLVTGSAFTGSSNQLFIARVNADGTKDETFVPETAPGISYPDLGANNSIAHSIHLYNDGSFLVGGIAEFGTLYDGVIVKFNSDGSIDESFGENGIANSTFSPYQSDGENRYRVTVSPDGYIYLPGYLSEESSEGTDFELARFTPGGSLDASFGTNGFAMYDFQGENDLARSAVVQEDGKIIVAGKAFVSNSQRFGMVRFNMDGSIDDTFGTNGAVGDFNGEDPHTLLLTPQGKILLMGIRQERLFSASMYLNPGGATTITPVSDALATDYTLEQNYPNPFNPTTTIRFAVAEAGNVSLKVYNTLGEEIAVLVNNQLSAGTYSVNFNAANLASGVYIYTLKAGQKALSNKMLLMK